MRNTEIENVNVDAVVPRDWSYTPWLRTKTFKGVASNAQGPCGARQLPFLFYYLYSHLRELKREFSIFGCFYRVV
jgi:hypothetical protein